ncbi:HAD-IIIA family hydrolase [Psychrobacillus sp. FJAT-51614]|uniref:D,D-heptose 1,7-bisphosphate phosphatase n=1 Tax=Psychrobacillus mangrovi TaxID=3117745 RepID=A0ABU8F827_9BACI
MDQIKNIEAVFIDRNGTIGGSGHFIHPKDFKPYEFSNDAFKLLKEHGIRMFAFTNQHRISRKEASITEFQEEFLSYGFNDAFICLHCEEAGCMCHKPKSGLLIEAARKHNLELKNCVVIGDVGSTDMLAAHAVGAMKILVLTGWGESSLHQYRDFWKDAEPDHIAQNLLEAVQYLLKTH